MLRNGLPIGWILCASALPFLLIETHAAPPKLPQAGTKAEKPAKTSPKRDEKSAGSLAADAFFNGRQVVELRIVISPEELEKLRADNRSYVRCDVTENGKTKYQSVAIKLKGAAGSFREFDDRPALTLKTDRFKQKQTFHGLDKFHLNNSVQDESYLNEFLSSEIFRKAGQPAARVSYARVWLNDRDVGLYVLKEGFDRKLLKQYFTDPTGNLYDGGFCQDIDVDLEKDTGEGPDDFSDLHRLREACSEQDAATRHKKLANTVDIDKFIDFMALEMMTVHWDGYSFSKNNYRLYFHPATGKAHFLPHGMDQMFGDPYVSVLEFPPALVASAVMHHPAWREKYRDRLRALLPVFETGRISKIVGQQRDRLIPVIKRMGDEPLQAFRDRVSELEQRLRDRYEHLKVHIEEAEPQPLEFNADGIAEITDFYPGNESDNVTHDQPTLEGERPAYQISSGEGELAIASWRRKVLLSAGRYRFVARAKVKDLEALADEKGAGVGLRISGSNREGQLDGTHDWTTLAYPFEVTDPIREIELVAEMRAKRGQVWFDGREFRLERINDAPPAE